MPVADPEIAAISETRQSNAALQLGCDGKSLAICNFGLQFLIPTPLFLRDFWRFGSVNAESASHCDWVILVR